MIKRFTIGFTLGLLLFFIITLTSAHLASDCGLMAVFGRDACADEREACPRRLAASILRRGRA